MKALLLKQCSVVPTLELIQFKSDTLISVLSILQNSGSSSAQKLLQSHQEPVLFMEDNLSPLLERIGTQIHKTTQSASCSTEQWVVQLAMYKPLLKKRSHVEFKNTIKRPRKPTINRVKWLYSLKHQKKHHVMIL